MAVAIRQMELVKVGETQGRRHLKPCLLSSPVDGSKEVVVMQKSYLINTSPSG